MSGKDNEDIWEFLDCWTSLTNDISNLESQLAQHPELAAVRYYIPAMVLQFEERLVDSYVKVIQKLNQQRGEDEENPAGQRPFFRSSSHAQRITSARSAFWTPCMMKIIRRAVRSAFFCRFTGFTSLGRSPIFCAMSLRTTVETVSTAVMKVGYDWENLEAYQNTIFKNLSLDDQLQNIFAMSRLNTMDAGVLMEEYCRNHIINCLIPLYKECYADIVMLLLLDCGFSDYYQCVYAEEYERVSQENSAAVKEIGEHHTDRMALVGLAVGGIKKKEWETFPLDEPWVNAAGRKMENWNKLSKDPDAPEYRWTRMYLPGNEINIYTLLADEAAQLLDYLKDCAKAICDRLKTLGKEPNFSGSLKQVRKQVLNARSETFNWNEMRKFSESQK